MKRNKSIILFEKDKNDNFCIYGMRSKYSLKTLAKALHLNKEYSKVNKDRYTLKEIDSYKFELIILHKRKKHFIKTFRKIYSQILKKEFGEISMNWDAFYIKDNNLENRMYGKYFNLPPISIDIGFALNNFFIIDEAHNLFNKEEIHLDLYNQMFSNVRKYGSSIIKGHQIPIASSFRGSIDQKEILNKIKRAKSKHINQYRQLDTFKNFMK